MITAGGFSHERIRWVGHGSLSRSFNEIGNVDHPAGWRAILARLDDLNRFTAKLNREIA
jgi:hypothetical protein